MKILQVGLGNNPGGMEAFVMNYFRELAKQGITFDFVCMYHKIAYEEEIRQLLTHRERAEGDNTSIGVENVLSRLKLNFGSRYGIRMESQPGQYTKTILTIPLMNERDG